MIKNPGDIIESVKQVPPFQQNSIEASYSGQLITWTLSFNSIGQVKKGNIWNVMSRNPGSYPWVYFDINIEQYPQFKLIHQDEELIVTGVIDRVSGHDINLKDIKNISFPKHDQTNTVSSSIEGGGQSVPVPWFQKPFDQIFIGLIILIIGGGILYYLGWN